MHEELETKDQKVFHFTLIDMTHGPVLIWVSINLMKEIANIDFLPKSFADYSPLLLELEAKYKPVNWRLNTLDLQDKKFVDNTKHLLKEFFEINENSVRYQRTVWDIAKAFFRGIAIKYRSKKKKEINDRYFELVKS